MSTCEWCGLSLGHNPCVVNNVWYHCDCLKYGKLLDTEAIGWEPTVVPTETE